MSVERNMENIIKKNLKYKRNKNAIRVWNLTKKFGDLTAVENSTFTIDKGTIVGILGQMVQVKRLPFA